MSATISAELAEDLVAIRRDLHQHPELGLDNPRTQQKILDALDGLGLEITLGRDLTSVVAVLRGGAGSGRAVLLRGDMDALPVAEDLDVDYASREPGLMHACGHDLHVAGLIGAARLLAARRDELAGEVIFMFQPGEEGPGGARIMLEEGLLDVAGVPVVAAYALHVGSAGERLGTWYGRSGPLMAAADEAVIRVIGAGGHGSQPHLAKDPVPVACEIVLAMQLMITRQFNAMEPMVLTVGKIVGGTKDNIIPDDATLELTLRTFDAEQRLAAQHAVRRLAEGIAAAHGLSAEVTWLMGYPVTVNDATEYAFLRATAEELFGADRYVDMPHPEAGAEDFSFVAEQVPSAYVFLSACAADDPLTAADNHSPRAHFDDSVVPDGALLLAELALRRLANPR
ncbi:MAG: M20 family metallopeptidase [Actinobacteria bacterium]|nr:M20 family metallopeptidase [Actinomycetota bacterium]